MSKRDLKKYLKELSAAQLEEQILDLYDRFGEVKTYYNFIFNPKEDKLITEAKFKINKEYFPQTRRKAKARRGVAQKYFKHFIQIGMEETLLADLMLFNIETAQSFNLAKAQKTEAFFKSIANSFVQALNFIHYHGLQNDFGARLESIVGEAKKQDWFNWELMLAKLEDAAASLRSQ
jgi:hypothetical protein